MAWVLETFTIRTSSRILKGTGLRLQIGGFKHSDNFAFTKWRWVIIFTPRPFRFIRGKARLRTVNGTYLIPHRAQRPPPGTYVTNILRLSAQSKSTSLWTMPGHVGAWASTTQRACQFEGPSIQLTQDQVRVLVRLSDSHKTKFHIKHRKGFLRFSDQNFVCNFQLLCVLHAPPISSFLIWSLKYLVKRTSYEAPHYGVSSILLPLPASQIKIFPSSVDIATDYGMDDRISRVRIPTGVKNFSFWHRVQTGPGAHSASYPMGNGGSFPGSKATRAWSWPLTSI
jgi:hypothetical protein